MATHTIKVEQLPYHPQLGRNVNHDSRSRGFPVRVPARATIAPVKHNRYVPVFNQGDTGSCTGNAGLGCLGTGVFYATVRATFDASGAEPNWSEDMARDTVYSLATRLDPFAGAFPPDDTGSDGLSVAKALRQLKFINGFEHGFSVEETLKAFQEKPFIGGINWYESMFDTSPAGEVKITSGSSISGGHEICFDEFDADGFVWFSNSWGSNWGVNGRGKMSLSTFTRLMDEDGDATFFVPLTDPAPTPQPIPDTDADIARLASDVHAWRKRSAPCLGSRTAQRAVNRFLHGRGL